MTGRRYLTMVRRAWLKDSLAKKVEEALDPFEPEDVVSVNYMDQPLYILGRRNSALITVYVRNSEPEEEP